MTEEQIKAAFAQSEKEVQDLHTRISQGVRESKRSGKTIGNVSRVASEGMRKTDAEIIKIMLS